VYAGAAPNDEEGGVPGTGAVGGGALQPAPLGGAAEGNPTPCPWAAAHSNDNPPTRVAKRRILLVTNTTASSCT